MVRYRTAMDSFPWLPKSIRIVVVGDKGTGKSSLIVAAATRSFPLNVPPVLPVTNLPIEFFPDGIPITIVDTSSRPEDTDIVAEEMKLADAVILTYACDRPETLDRLTEYWLPELQRLEVKVPVIVAGCKFDLRDDDNTGPYTLYISYFEQVVAPIMQLFHQIETCMECSALKKVKVQEVLYFAHKSVLHPTGPIFDKNLQALKTLCFNALKRIFKLCDRDNDGALSEAELNDFQVKCFHAPLQPSHLEGVKKVVNEKSPEGVNERGLTLTGFMCLHEHFIKNGKLEMTWTVLRKFGYNNDLRLADELLPASLFKREPDQSVELTNVAIEFLNEVHTTFAQDVHNILGPQEVDIFSTAPESPWKEAPYEDASTIGALGGIHVDNFLSLWSLMTLLEPARSVEHLIYLGFRGDPSTTIRLTRRRSLDRKQQKSDRNVFQCFVFGPNNAGKSALLNCFIGRSYDQDPESTTDDRYAVNMIHEFGGAKITLVMREIPEDGVKSLLSSKEALAACDLALFFYDNSDESSWKRATELLIEVSTHGEATGYEVPCLMVAAKHDLDSFPSSIEKSIKMTQDIGIEPAVSISSKLRDYNKLFRRILSVTQHPHLSIPKTKARQSRKHNYNSRLMTVSIGAAAVVVVGVAAYRVYATRKNASG